MGVGEKYNPTQKKPHRLNGGALEGIYGMPCQASGAEAGIVLEGVTQVVDITGNPLVFTGDSQFPVSISSFLFIPYLFKLAVFLTPI